MFDPPGYPKTNFSTPSSELVSNMFGSNYFEGVSYSKDEVKHMKRLYAFSDQEIEEAIKRSVQIHEEESARKRKEDEKLPEYQRKNISWSTPDIDGLRKFLSSGGDRNMFRHAQRDGLRMVAFLSRYVEPGTDPVKTLVQMAVDAGYDVDPADAQWAFWEQEREEETAEEQGEAGP